jgi:hypothetical protein
MATKKVCIVDRKLDVVLWYKANYICIAHQMLKGGFVENHVVIMD